MKVYITGGSGSGKTTMAKQMSAHYGVACLDLDTVKWQNEKGKRFVCARCVDARMEIIADFIAQNSQWICEGAYYHDWIDPILENVDLVIVLRVSRWRRHWRCIRRALFEEGLHRMSWRALWDLLCWDHKYDKCYWPILKSKLDKNSIPYKFVKSAKA